MSKRSVKNLALNLIDRFGHLSPFTKRSRKWLMLWFLTLEVPKAVFVKKVGVDKYEGAVERRKKGGRGEGRKERKEEGKREGGMEEGRK